jgi:hypothetical protein
MVEAFKRMLHELISRMDPTGKVDWKKIANSSKHITPPPLPEKIRKHLK